MAESRQRGVGVAAIPFSQVVVRARNSVRCDVLQHPAWNISQPRKPGGIECQSRGPDERAQSGIAGVPTRHVLDVAVIRTDQHIERVGLVACVSVSRRPARHPGYHAAQELIDLLQGGDGALHSTRCPAVSVA